MSIQFGVIQVIEHIVQTIRYEPTTKKECLDLACSDCIFIPDDCKCMVYKFYNK